MNVPFIAIDTRTGFHLASNGLELTGAQTKSKSALAVLCNSILLLWSNVATTEACEADQVPSRSFVVDIATGSETTDSVRYFHSNGRFLCVVFGADRHPLYAAFAERLAQRLIDDGPKALKNCCAVRSIAQEALKAAFIELCTKEGLAECVLVSKSSTVSFTCSHGDLDDSAADIFHSFDTVSVPGIYACGTLMYAVHEQGEARCVVVAYDEQLASFEKIATDGLLVKCCLSACAALE